MIEGLNKIELSKQPIFKDNRGRFIPIKLDGTWVQSNISVNEGSYVLRGMHLQKAPKQQSKMVTVLSGRIVDIVTDLRVDSPTYKLTEYYVLEEGDCIFVPKGYAHGFLTLSHNAIVNYLVDEEYSPEHEVSILWSSIPEVVSVVDRFCITSLQDVSISYKDKNAPTLQTYLNN